MTSDSEGLSKIANIDDPARPADIVFLHGLRDFIAQCEAEVS
jgi:hypothetical protein